MSLLIYYEYRILIRKDIILNMYFYEVLVSSPRYHGSSPLTYSSEQVLSDGLVVSVPFGTQEVLGIVRSKVKQPDFDSKPVLAIVDAKPLPAALLQLHEWLTEYYPGPLGMTTQLFLPNSLSKTGRKQAAQAKTPLVPATQPHLTPEQTLAVNTVQLGSGSFLLHGATGSGKTRVYIELASQAIATGESVLLLTPEIGLTPQLTASLEAAFPDQVVTIHSTQTPVQRRNHWRTIHHSEAPLVVIGPRSALFAPLHNIGSVILDEAHDGAYKQEQMPYYQATRVAAKLSELAGAKLILGSATPQVHDYYAFSAKKLPIIDMKQQANQQETAVTTTVVDLTARENFTRSAWLSDELVQSVEVALNSKTQSLLFLNRRGTARLVLCQNCGWQATCPRCDLPLTYHGDHHHLRCHTCGFTTRTPSACPECAATDIQFKSIGTKTIVSEVTRLFPKANIQRFDSDTKKSDNLESQYQSIQDGSVDILVGTQMLSKGLDLPRLSVVGVIAADTSLYFPDYTAEERTFQMLRQVIGRVGRGHREGRVVIQSYHPNSTTIQAAVNKDYASFYAAQLAERELYKFPPFYFVLKISVERATQPAAAKATQELATTLLSAGLAIEVTGPAPAFVEKSYNKYRWQLIIKAKQRTQLIEVVKILPKNCHYDIDPTNLL